MKYTEEYLRFFFCAFIGQASIHIPQLEQEYISASAYPLRGCHDLIPAFFRVMKNISVGICIYLVNGRQKKNVPSAIEYAHQVGRMW